MAFSSKMCIKHRRERRLIEIEVVCRNCAPNLRLFICFFFFWALLNGPLSCAILSNWWKDHWSGTRLRKLIWILRRNAMHFTVFYQCNESIEHIYIETKLQILKFDCLQTLKKQMVFFRCCCLKSWLFEDRNDKRSDDESYLSLIKIIFIIHSVSDRLAS